MTPILHGKMSSVAWCWRICSGYREAGPVSLKVAAPVVDVQVLGRQLLKPQKQAITAATYTGIASMCSSVWCKVYVVAKGSTVPFDLPLFHPSSISIRLD